jgi:hypothetical protein
MSQLMKLLSRRATKALVESAVADDLFSLQTKLLCSSRSDGLTCAFRERY